MSSTFGTLFRVATFGESHGVGVTKLFDFHAVGGQRLGIVAVKQAHGRYFPGVVLIGAHAATGRRRRPCGFCLRCACATSKTWPSLSRRSFAPYRGQCSLRARLPRRPHPAGPGAVSPGSCMAGGDIRLLPGVRRV